jgi:hypothetical protein
LQKSLASVGERVKDEREKENSIPFILPHCLRELLLQEVLGIRTSVAIGSAFSGVADSPQSASSSKRLPIRQLVADSYINLKSQNPRAKFVSKWVFSVGCFFDN